MLVYGILFIILTGLSWVYAGVAVSVASRRGFGVIQMQLMTSVIGMLLTGLIMLAGCHLFPEYQRFSFHGQAVPALCLFMNGFLNFFMYVFMSLAMTRGPSGLAWTITQSGLIFPFLMGVLVFGTEATPLRLTGFAAVLANVFVSGISKESGETRKTSGFASWFPPALLAMVFCGLNQCAANLPSYIMKGTKTSPTERMFWVQVGTFCAWSLYSLALNRRKKTQIPSGGIKLLVFLSVTMILVSVNVYLFLFFTGLDILAEAGRGAISYPIAVQSCFLGFFVYSKFILKEKNTPAQIIAFFIGLAGIVLLCA